MSIRKKFLDMTHLDQKTFIKQVPGLQIKILFKLYPVALLRGNLVGKFENLGFQVLLAKQS